MRERKTDAEREREKESSESERWIGDVINLRSPIVPGEFC